jgi:hypothetical protein
MCELLKNYNDENVLLMKKHIKKQKSINPKLKIEKFTLPDGRTFKVCQDGDLIAGTKQRFAVKYVRNVLKDNPNIKYILYSGLSNGYGNVVTAYAAYKLNIKSILFLAKLHSMTDKEIKSSRQISTIHALNGKIYLCDDYGLAKNKKYEINDDKNQIPKKDHFILPMGLNDKNDTGAKILAKQLKLAIKNTELIKHKKKRFWLVMGVGGLLHALYKLFPNSEFFVYIVNKGTYLEENINWCKSHNINILNEFKLNENKLNKLNLKREDYYNSTKNYDDLIWPYLIQYGKSGDYIWNVASDNIPN